MELVFIMILFKTLHSHTIFLQYLDIQMFLVLNLYFYVIKQLQKIKLKMPMMTLKSDSTCAMQLIHFQKH